MRTLRALIDAFITIPLLGCTPARAPCEAACRYAEGAADLLHAMFVRYSTATTYQDTGVATSSYRHDGGIERKTRVEFTTIFDRATDAIAFQYTVADARGAGSVHRGSFWRPDAGTVSTWRSIEPRVEVHDISEALPMFYVESGDASAEIPEMLLQLDNERLGEFVFRVEAEENVQGVPCIRLRAGNDDHVRLLWVGKGDHALRMRFARDRTDPRVVAKSLTAIAKGGAFPPSLAEEARDIMEHQTPLTIESTIEYEPVFDRPIDPAQFTFTPPP
jgi:hypothetical protein